MNDRLEILWKSRIWRDGSSAIISREMTLAFDRLGCRVQVDSLGSSLGRAGLLDDSQRRARLAALEATAPLRAGMVAIRCAASDENESGLIEGMWDVTAGARANVVYLTLPYGYLSANARPATANRLLQQVWACSGYVAGTLLEMGFEHDKVHSVPLGYAPDIFHPQVMPVRLETHKTFKFVHVSIPYVTMKGIDALIQSYFEEFDRNDDVVLVLQSRTSAEGRECIDDLIGQQRHRTGHDPEVLFLADGMSHRALASLYAACNCYVQVSRCEGFGMPVLEALACGIPAIAINFGGHLEMCTARNSYLFEPLQLTPPSPAAIKEGLQSIAWWAEPDVQELRRLMRHAYENPVEVKEKGRYAAVDVKNRMTWSHSANRALQVLSRLS